MIRKNNQKPAQKRGGGDDKKPHINRKASQATQPHVQVQSTMRSMDSSTYSKKNHTELEARPSKRLKRTATEGLDDTISQKTTGGLPKNAAISTKEDFTASRDTQVLPPEFQQLQSSFEFTKMSINSWSKMEKSVRKLLLSLEKFSFADLNSKPGVVVLSAKASVATKMVSIVEIAKRVIDKDHGKWYQYSKIQEDVVPLKQKPMKRNDGGKTVSEWQAEQKRPREDSSEGATVHEVEETKLGGNENEEDEDAFETLGSAGLHKPKTTTEEHEARRKIRAVPVMTIYMSRVAVPGLKNIFGCVKRKIVYIQKHLLMFWYSEQTNA